MNKFHFLTAASLIALMSAPSYAQNSNDYKNQNNSFSAIGKNWQNSNQNSGGMYNATQNWDNTSKKIKADSTYNSVNRNSSPSIFSSRKPSGGSVGTVDSAGKVRSPNERPVPGRN